MFYNSTVRSFFAGNLTASSSAAGLEVVGGTLALAGEDSYQGVTTIDPGGVLILASSGALPSASNVSIGPGGTLIFDPSVTSAPVHLGGSSPVPRLCPNRGPWPCWRPLQRRASRNLEEKKEPAIEVTPPWALSSQRDVRSLKSVFTRGV